MAGEISVETFPKNTVISVQGRTKLERVYIVKEGSLELFYETNGERELSGALEPGESFGGVSILMNAGISVRTVMVVDDATLYSLPRNVFLEICARHMPPLSLSGMRCIFFPGWCRSHFYREKK